MRFCGNILRRLVSSISIGVFFVMPLAPLFVSADEIELAPPAQPEIISEEVTENPETSATLEILASEEVSAIHPINPNTETESETTVTESENVELADESTESIDETNHTENNSTETDTEAPAIGDEDVINDAGSAEIPFEALDEKTEQVETLEDGVIHEDVPVTPVGTTTDTSAEENAPVSTTIIREVPILEGDNILNFSKAECVDTGRGSYYCTRATTSLSVVKPDGVISIADQDGDMEIYLREDGDLKQLTTNLYDDTAPQYDEVSNTIVWQRLIEGRSQIIQYDLKSELEKQLTFDNFNNAEPYIYGDAIVWQGWVGNDWDVFYMKNGEVKMLTDNTSNDVTPRINGDHIIWKAFEGDRWNMKIYDVQTGHIETVTDAAGGSIENPRFVLVYDAKMESGDVETRGYDLEKKEITPLSATAAPVPEKLPDPEQTGEDRALVAPQTQPKPKADDTTPDDQPLDYDTDMPDETDIVVPPLDLSTTTPDVLVEDGSVVVDEVEDATSTTEIALEELIPDLVVPPYVGLSEGSASDSQLEIVEVE